MAYQYIRSTNNRFNIIRNYLLSSFNIVTVAMSGLPWLTSLGNDSGAMASIKFSCVSSTLSLIIGTSNEPLVCPAGIVTLYGPEA